MARSLNRVQLIGNLTRDPELRYTPQGTAVCSFGLATNRGWTTDSGEKKEEAEFHKIVAWNKLGELCSQLLSKGRKVYVEGRLSSKNWTGQDGVQRNTTEIVINDMIILDSKRDAESSSSGSSEDYNQDNSQNYDYESQEGESKKEAKKTKSGEEDKSKKSEDVNPDDIPF